MPEKPSEPKHVAAGQGPTEQRGLSPVSQVAGPVFPPPRPEDIALPLPPVSAQPPEPPAPAQDQGS